MLQVFPLSDIQPAHTNKNKFKVKGKVMNLKSFIKSSLHEEIVNNSKEQSDS
jgi:hypothetical protein